MTKRSSCTYDIVGLLIIAGLFGVKAMFGYLAITFAIVFILAYAFGGKV